MQAAKDTFLRTLADRLAVVNPSRTLTLDGASRPAVIALENEDTALGNSEPETFQLSWEGASQVPDGSSLMYMDCKLSYGSRGTDDMLRTDRGRILTAMDCELLLLCRRRSAAKCDYAQTPPLPLGTKIFWSQPVMATPSEVDGMLMRTATIRLFFFSEGV
ncbi:MAG TPA: hypothetical protein VM578_07045 [Candidatus Saccharimonadales bacterium]|nr:hypothetical protein [Candidatus Saccharimonadales bacterium]